MTRSRQSTGSRATSLGAAAVMATLLLAVGCGKEQQQMTGPQPSADFPYGRCDVKISGAVQAEYQSAGGPDYVHTVYWMTDEELRSYFAWKARNETKLGIEEEDVPLFVDQAMARNPRFVTLLIRCDTEGTSLTLVPGLGTRYEDVPFRPGSYTVAASSLVDETVPGLFAAQASIVVGDRVVHFASTGGTLNVEAFDSAHLTGNFRFQAQEGTLAITVEGVFHYIPSAVDGSDQ